MGRGRRLSLPAVAAAVLLALLGAVMAWRIMTIGVAAVASGSRVGLVAHELRPENPRGTAEAASEAFAAGDLDQAERLAKLALRHSPAEVLAIRTLGQVRNAREGGSGDELLLISARLGWRDVPTQLWIIERAILAGMPELAMERAEALVRLQRERELVFTLLRMLAVDPEGREVLVRSLAEDPFWRRDFLSPTQTIPADQVVPLARILRDLARTDVPPRPVEARFAIDVLAQEGRTAAALALYRDLFPQAAGNAPLRDGGFERDDVDHSAGGASNVFDWRLFSEGGAAAGIDPAPGGEGRQLYVLSGGTVRARVLSQMLVLDPGTYQLTYRVRGEEPGATERIGWHLRCADLVGATLLEPAREALPDKEWHRRTRRFTVPQGCGAQLLELHSLPEIGSPDQVAWFDDVAIRPVG